MTPAAGATRGCRQREGSRHAHLEATARRACAATTRAAIAAAKAAATATATASFYNATGATATTAAGGSRR